MSHANLWAPWRMTYLRELTQKAEAAGVAAAQTVEGDFIAAAWAAPADDERNLVVYRNEDGLVMLNRYPYANGHLMAALGEPRPRLLEYSPSQRTAFWRLTEIAMVLMQNALSPQGINMGINEGRAAGAGLPEHLHAHIIPRWNGDTNFITTVGQIRVIPGALEAMWREYRRVADR